MQLVRPFPAPKPTLPPPEECCRNGQRNENPPPVLPDESSSPRKNISLSEIRNACFTALTSPQHEGRSAIVTTRGAGCNGRKGTQAMRIRCGRSSRVVVVPRRWDQVRGHAISALRPKRRRHGRRRLTSPVLRREREVSRKPLRRECRMFRPTCTDLWASFLFSPRALRVRPAPGIPCALSFEGATRICITRTRNRAAGMRSHIPQAV